MIANKTLHVGPVFHLGYESEIGVDELQAVASYAVEGYTEVVDIEDFTICCCKPEDREEVASIYAAKDKHIAAIWFDGEKVDSNEEIEAMLEEGAMEELEENYPGTHYTLICRDYIGVE